MKIVPEMKSWLCPCI